MLPCDMSQVACDVACHLVPFDGTSVRSSTTNAHTHTIGININLAKICERHAYLTLMLLSNDLLYMHECTHCVGVSIERCNYYAIHHIDLCIGSLCQCTVANQCTHCACCFIRFSCCFFFLLLLNSLTGAIDSRSRALRTDSDQKFKQLLLIITL